jgi:hypothetical protein
MNGNIMAGPLPRVCEAIAAGKANTVAMIFAVASRSSNRQFGGMTHTSGASIDDLGVKRRALITIIIRGVGVLKRPTGR